MKKLIATVVAAAFLVGGGMVAFAPSEAFAGSKEKSKCSAIKDKAEKKACKAGEKAAKKAK